MMGETLELEDYRAHKRMVTVTDHNPDLAVKVRRKGRDGILVSIDKGLLIFEGERHLYVVDKERIFRCDEACSATLHVFLEQMIKSFGSNCEAEVNDKDMPLFYERVLKKIAAYSTIDAGDVGTGGIQAGGTESEIRVRQPGTERPGLKAGSVLWGILVSAGGG